MEKEMVEHNLPGFDIRIEIMDNAKGGFADTHFHNEYEMLFIDKYNVDYFVNNIKILMSPGDTMFVNASVPHSTDVPKGTDAKLLLFHNYNNNNKNIVSNHISRLGLINNVDYYLFKKGTSDGDKIASLVNDICNEYQNQCKSYISFIKAYIDNITAILQRKSILIDQNESYNIKSMTRIMPVLNYIEEHYNEHISLPQVCNLINLSEFHFCKLFKKYMKIPFMQYLNFVRICYSELLLQNSEKSISEIAYETGFSSAAHFSSVFKKQKNMSPTEYKKYLKK